MSQGNGRAAATATAVVVAALLAGCAQEAGPDPEARPTVTETVTASPRPGGQGDTDTDDGAEAGRDAVDRIVVDGEGLELWAGEELSDEVSFVEDDLEAAVAVLAAVLAGDGEPAGVVGDRPCVADQTRYGWEEAMFLGTSAQATDEGSLTFVAVGPTVRGLDGDVRVETPEGVAVGDVVQPLVDAATAIDPTLVEVASSDQTSTRVIYDLVRDDTDEVGSYHYGAEALAIDDVVTTLESPRYLQDRC
ncbi:hypothetical protein [Frigoribacterium salinisoli]